MNADGSTSGVNSDYRNNTSEPSARPPWLIGSDPDGVAGRHQQPPHHDPQTPHVPGERPAGMPANHPSQSAEHAAIQQDWFAPVPPQEPSGRTDRWNAVPQPQQQQQAPPSEFAPYRPGAVPPPSPPMSGPVTSTGHTAAPQNPGHPQPQHPSQPHPQHPGQPQPQHPPTPNPHQGVTPTPMPPQSPPLAPALDDVEMLNPARRAPRRGWRRAVHTVSRGSINPGDSADDIATDLLKERINQSVRGDYRIAVVSLKGGVGKTTTTIGLGSTFASVRGDRVIAVDANPDLGTLAQRVPRQTPSTVRDLIADPNIRTYADVRMHTSQASSRLEILASERDPATSEAFSEAEYRQTLAILQRYYNIIITDCGTGMSHSAMNGVLDVANAIILVSSPAMDAARSASATLDWLQAHGHGHLVSRSVVVLSSSRPGASSLNVDQLTQHFLSRCRAVRQIPFDDHLAEGAEVDIGLWSHATGQAFLELAAVVADDFPATTMKRNAPFYY